MIQKYKSELHLYQKTIQTFFKYLSTKFNLAKLTKKIRFGKRREQNKYLASIQNRRSMTLWDGD